MKIKFNLAMVVLAAASLAQTAQAQGTAFTYQGRLSAAGAFASGSYDIQFTLFSTNVTGIATAGPITNANISITNGLFSTTIDFGNVFKGASNWLEIAVSTNKANVFSKLAPRQQLTPTPYAQFAQSAGGVSGLVVQYPAGTVPNLIGGYSGNVVDNGAQGSVIGGGGTAGFVNHVSSTLATVSGGSGNLIGPNANDSFIGGGRINEIDSGAWGAVIDGGHANWIQSANNPGGGAANSSYSAIGGGFGNVIQSNAISSTIGGGNGNVVGIGAQYATIPGGSANKVSGNYSFAAGSVANAMHNNTFVWNDGFFQIGQGGFASTGPNQFLVHASGGVGINTATPGPGLDLSVNSGLAVDNAGANNGTTAHALLFGGAGGEGIGSDRTGTHTDSYGLNFYTAYAKRLTILQNGSVGIGTATPGSNLEVNGSEAVDNGLKVTGAVNYSISNGVTSAGIVSVSSQVGVYGNGNTYGVMGESANGYGVYGICDSTVDAKQFAGVAGESFPTSNDNFPNDSAAVLGITHGSGYGIHGLATGGNSTVAGYFDGEVIVTTILAVNGPKNFKIDHPLDPANKYLVHSCIESPDVMNLYNGNVTTDSSGDARVKLPYYFLALNAGDYRYQLTVIGQFAQAIVSSEIQSNSLGVTFGIKTDKPNVRVSWQVMGVRSDAVVQAHRPVVEQDKPANEKGYYFHPELFGQPEEKSLAWAHNPGLMKHLKEEESQRAARGQSSSAK